MKQPDFIDLVISAVVLDNGMAKGNYTLVGSVTLVNNQDDAPVSSILNYSSAIGILLCLSSHTHPYIDFEINCCSIYMFCPKHFHAYSLKKIGRYLKLTKNCGFILNTNRELFNIDNYPDADCSDKYGNYKPDDTSFFKIRTG